MSTPKALCALLKKVWIFDEYSYEICGPQLMTDLSTETVLRSL